MRTLGDSEIIIKLERRQTLTALHGRVISRNRLQLALTSIASLRRFISRHLFALDHPTVDPISRQFNVLRGGRQGLVEFINVGSTTLLSK